ncbi:MAG: hypothetical protein R2795_05670 [Saprospiraceae bacterium]
MTKGRKKPWLPGEMIESIIYINLSIKSLQTVSQNKESAWKEGVEKEV